jgi:hypothetical protein
VLTLLLNPAIRKVLIVFGLATAFLIGYSFWSSHLQSIGAANEKAKEAEIAIQHDQQVKSQAAAVEQEVAKDPSPQDTLLKEWSQK